MRLLSSAFRELCEKGRVWMLEMDDTRNVLQIQQDWQTCALRHSSLHRACTGPRQMGSQCWERWAWALTKKPFQFDNHKRKISFSNGVSLGLYKSHLKACPAGGQHKSNSMLFWYIFLSYIALFVLSYWDIVCILGFLILCSSGPYVFVSCAFVCTFICLFSIERRYGAEWADGEYLEDGKEKWSEYIVWKSIKPLPC